MPGSVQQWTFIALVKKTSLHFDCWKTTDRLVRAGYNTMWPAWALVWSQRYCVFINPIELYWIATINKYFNMGCMTFLSPCRRKPTIYFSIQLLCTLLPRPETPLHSSLVAIRKNDWQVFPICIIYKVSVTKIRFQQAKKVRITWGKVEAVWDMHQNFQPNGHENCSKSEKTSVRIHQELTNIKQECCPLHNVVQFSIHNPRFILVSGQSLVTLRLFFVKIIVRETDPRP
jgi:hypothetical protein